ncbi:vomeronasal type-1 receptor 4-like [Ochotona curzoniae]|uniref:vomeronasal type-1 receptor 4-like n=1 Tax=Ochotona curzoniae TaxID=130825 RepID=UPI001B347914|nr:vomeronasal type-1 receptor 4-like [Ochotona curzoniae]
MGARDLPFGMLFLSQVSIGMLGNFCLLSHYVHLYYTGCKFRPTDLTIRHLTVANCLVILSNGVIQTMAAFGVKDFLSDMGCKLVFYVYRVGRDVSINTTSLLSVSQAITISPNSSRWAELKAKLPRYIGPCNILCWMLNLMVDVMVPLHMYRSRNDKNITKKTDHGSCYSVSKGVVTKSLYAAFVFSRDVCSVGLLLWSSGFMVLTLYRHKQQVQHIRRSNTSSRCSPASRATHSILVLVSTFVSLCTVSTIIHICFTVVETPSWWLVHTSALLTGSFPAVSPYILLSHDSRVPRLCSGFSEERRPCFE